MEALLYRSHAQASSTLIAVPGLHPDGIYDPRFGAFASACTAAGFQVIALDVREFREFSITLGSVDLIAALVRSLPKYLPEDSMRSLGLLGISYGAGPIFLAAALPEVRKRVHFLISIGGYFNLSHATDFVLTGLHGSEPPVADRVPQQWGRMIFALNHMDVLVPGTDRAGIGEIFRLRLRLQDQEANQKESGLSGEGLHFLRNVLEGLPPEELQRFREVLRSHKELFDRLSPETIMEKLDPKIRIYLLHGRSDDLIPFEETQELERALQARQLDIRSLVTASLTHVDVRTGGDVWSAFRMLRWIGAVLRET